METTINKTTDGVKEVSKVSADIFVENKNDDLEAVCGKLQFNHQDGNTTYYDVI